MKTDVIYMSEQYTDMIKDKNAIKVSRNCIDNNTVQSTYDTSQGKFIVNSHFTGDAKLSELIYQIIMKNEDSRSLHIK